MSSQNSIRTLLLSAIFVSLSQVGFAQDAETLYAYSEVYTTIVSAPQEWTGPDAPNTFTAVNKSFDFSKGSTSPKFKSIEDYVALHLIYPDFAEANTVEGSVLLSLKLSSTGEVLCATVEESLGYGCDEAALALVENMPAWTPATNYGVAVGAKQLVAIDFRLR